MQITTRFYITQVLLYGKQYTPKEMLECCNMDNEVAKIKRGIAKVTDLNLYINHHFLLLLNDIRQYICEFSKIQVLMALLIKLNELTIVSLEDISQLCSEYKYKYSITQIFRNVHF